MPIYKHPSPHVDNVPYHDSHQSFNDSIVAPPPGLGGREITDFIGKIGSKKPSKSTTTEFPKRRMKKVGP